MTTLGDELTHAATDEVGTATAAGRRRRPAARSVGEILRKIALGLIVPILIVAIWDIAVRANWISHLLLPSPWTVAGSAKNYLFETPAGREDVLGSSYRVLVGFGLATVVGVPLGLAIGLWRTAFELFSPLLSYLKNIAPIAWIPLAIIWFGLGDPPAFFLIIVGCIFPIILNTVDGVRSVDRVYLRVAQNVGASTFSIFRSVVFPGALPGILTGLRVALGVAWMCVIVAEMVAVNSGLGFRETQAREYGWVDIVLVTMLTIGVLGFLYDRVIVIVSRRMLRWHGGIHS
jgi:NitT/TauT family transport system permease protein